MSHSQGRIKFPDGTIKFLEYNGTSDVMLPFIYDTEEELQANWRRRDWKYCNNKEHNHIEVDIATSYGGGFSWKAKACVECNCLVDNLMPFDNNYDTMEWIIRKDGMPEWWPNREK